MNRSEMIICHDLGYTLHIDLVGLKLHKSTLLSPIISEMYR